jgi:hypothetical protein
MLTRIVAGGNILLNLVRGGVVNRQWMEIRGTRLNIQRLQRQIGKSGATIVDGQDEAQKVVRAGRENIFVELHRDELKWLQVTARDLNLRVLNAQEPTYSIALCGALSINVVQHQVACKACAAVENERRQTTVVKKKLFRPNERGNAIRVYATDNPQVALETFIEPMETAGWTLGSNRTTKLKTLDNALRNYRASASLGRGHLLNGRPYRSIEEPVETLVETLPETWIETATKTEPVAPYRSGLPGQDLVLVGDTYQPDNFNPDITADTDSGPYIVEEKEPAAAPVSVVTDSVLISTLDGLVKLAQERVDEHMMIADQWENIKATITSLVSDSQASEEKLRSAQAEVDATKRKLNAVIAAMSDQG